MIGANVVDEYDAISGRPAFVGKRHSMTMNNDGLRRRLCVCKWTFPVTNPFWGRFGFLKPQRSQSAWSWYLDAEFRSKNCSRTESNGRMEENLVYRDYSRNASNASNARKGRHLPIRSLNGFAYWHYSQVFIFESMSAGEDIYSPRAFVNVMFERNPLAVTIVARRVYLFASYFSRAASARQVRPIFENRRSKY
jgi:hypothetical protein